MRANFVDRLLAQVDGELAPIWISGLATVDAAPSVSELRAALAILVDEIERLRLAWSPRRGDWIPRARTAADVERAVNVATDAPGEVVPRLIREPIDLERDLPIRITVAPRADTGDGALLAVQLHHAISDGRSVLHLARRLWQILRGRTRPESRLGTPGLSDGRALAAAARNLRALPSILAARHRVLARRGHALRRSGDHAGAPLLRSLRAPLAGRFSAEERSGLFYGAVLAGMLAHDGERAFAAPIRLRVPVDLRPALKIGPSLENACSAVAVELPGDTVRRLIDDPAAFARLVPDELRRLLGAGVHFGTLLECLVVSRLASPATLRRHLGADLVAARRANTMVTTYLGSVDRYFADAPMAVRTFRVHTPTLGANGSCLGDALTVNVTSFAGLWSPADLEVFTGAAAAWLERHFGLCPELLP